MTFFWVVCALSLFHLSKSLLWSKELTNWLQTETPALWMKEKDISSSTTLKWQSLKQISSKGLKQTFWQSMTSLAMVMWACWSHTSRKMGVTEEEEEEERRHPPPHPQFLLHSLSTPVVLGGSDEAWALLQFIPFGVKNILKRNNLFWDNISTNGLLSVLVPQCQLLNDWQYSIGNCRRQSTFWEMQPSDCESSNSTLFSQKVRNII